MRSRRLVEKNGEVNIQGILDNKWDKWRFNLIGLRWYYFVSLFSAIHVLSFFVFGGLYNLTILYHETGNKTIVGERVFILYTATEIFKLLVRTL